MKNFSRMSLTATILFLLNIAIVHAATFDPVTAKLRYIFFNLSGAASFAVWLKFAFFVIIFAVLYGAGSRVKVFGEGPMKRALAVMTFVIALTSAIFVPYKLMLYIFKLYHAILVVLFGVLPALVGYLVASRIPVEQRWGRVIRGFIYLLITVFIFGLIGQIEATSSPETELYMEILEPLMYGAIIAFVLGIFNLLMAMGGDTAAQGLWNRMTGGGQPQAAGAGAGAGAAAQAAGAGAAGAQPPNPQQIQQLQQLMMQFYTRVLEAPNNIHQQGNQFHNWYLQNLYNPLQNIEHQQAQAPLPTTLTPQTVMRLMPVIQQANPELHRQLQHDAQFFRNAVQQIQQRLLTPARNDMNQVFQLAQQTGQYGNVPQQVRDMFELAIAQFLLEEATLIDDLNMVAHI